VHYSTVAGRTRMVSWMGMRSASRPSGLSTATICQHSRANGANQLHHDTRSYTRIHPDTRASTPAGAAGPQHAPSVPAHLGSFAILCHVASHAGVDVCAWAMDENAVLLCLPR
jgi:hypothetical protein